MKFGNASNRMAPEAIAWQRNAVQRTAHTPPILRGGREYAIEWMVLRGLGSPIFGLLSKGADWRGSHGRAKQTHRPDTFGVAVCDGADVSAMDAMGVQCKGQERRAARRRGQESKHTAHSLSGPQSASPRYGSRWLAEQRKDEDGTPSLWMAKDRINTRPVMAAKILEGSETQGLAADSLGSHWKGTASTRGAIREAFRNGIQRSGTEGLGQHRSASESKGLPWRAMHQHGEKSPKL